MNETNNNKYQQIDITTINNNGYHHLILSMKEYHQIAININKYSKSQTNPNKIQQMQIKTINNE